MKKILFDCGTRDATASFGILALRMMVGLMMLMGHGLPKFQDFAKYKDSFPVPEMLPFRLMSPPVSMGACIFAEVVCAALVILGLATRPAAFILGFVMVVAAFSYHANAAWFVKPPTIMEAKELSLMYLIPMITVILTGAGSYSLDALFPKDVKRRRW